MRDTTPTVDAIDRLNFKGHIIPHSWYKQIILSGKPDLVAITVLSDIIYSYRPTEHKDELTGEIEYHKKFRADKLQRSYQQLADQFGITKRQAHDACHRLQDLGLITLEFREIVSGGLPVNNVLYIEPVIGAIEAITFDDTPLPRFNVGGGTLKRGTYTENTTRDHSVSGSAEDRIPSTVTQPSLLVNSDEPPPIEAKSQCETPSGDCENLHNPNALLPRTPGTEYLFSLLAIEAKERGRRPPKKFRSVQARDDMEQAEARVGLERFKEIIVYAVRKMGNASLDKMVNYILGAAVKSAPARERVSGPMFNALAKALRLDPNASEKHAERLAKLTEVVTRAGYTTDIVRKAGNNWWEFGYGKQGSTPSDSQFIARLKFVQEERM